MEVIVNRSTTVLSSPRKIDNVIQSAAASSETITITLGQLQQLQQFQSVTTNAKVIKVSESMEVKPGLSKQDLTIADATGTARLTLWQTDINKLDEGECYRLENLLVKNFMKFNYLSPRMFDEFSFAPIDAVEDEPEEEWNNLKGAEVSTVSNFSRCSFCSTCNGKVEPKNSRIGCCTMCCSAQRLDSCKTTISVSLLISSEGKTRRLQASLQMIKAIAEDDSFTDSSSEDEVVESLLMARPFSITFDAASNYIKDVKR